MGAPRPRNKNGDPVSGAQLVHDELVRRFRAGETSVTRDAVIEGALVAGNLEATDEHRTMLMRAVSHAVGQLRAKRKLVILQRRAPPIYGPGPSISKRMNGSSSKHPAIRPVGKNERVLVARQQLAQALDAESLGQAHAWVQSALHLLEDAE